MKFCSLVVLSSMTSVVSFGDVKDPDGTVCERIMRGEAVNSCGSEWVGTYGCDSSWMDVCGTDHPGGPAYNDVTVAQSQLCQTECPDDGGGFPFEQIVSHSDFWCGGDQPDRMMSDSQGALSGSCEEAISMMETQWGVNGENACVDPGALPYESGAPRGWFQFVCCNTCGVGTMH